MPAPYFSVASYRRAVEEAIARGEYSNALVDLALKAEAVKNEPLSLVRVFGSPALDHLCHELGRAYASALGIAPAPAAGPAPEAIHVCTETYGTGGHARVIADLIRAQPGRLHHVVFTNLWEREKLFTSEFERLGARVTVLAKAPPLDKLRELLHLLARSPAASLFLFNHHQDSIAVAGVAGAGQAERYFIHHCDYQFCLGPFLPGVAHVDLHTMGYHRCRRELGIEGNLYWPLTCDDSSDTRAGGFLGGPGLTTCCCGSENKFTGTYPISYFDTVAEILRAVPGRHIHIGPLQDAPRQRLAARLREFGIPLDRFVYLPSVPDLRRALVEHHVDAYLVSFPMGGGRAMIEAMAAGVPVVGHIHHRDKMLSGTDLLPEDAPLWTDVPELLAILKGMTADRLQQLSVAARARYEAHHHPRLLAECVAGGRRLEPPPERVGAVEPMQTFLFEQNYASPPPRPAPAWGAGGSPGRRLPV